MPDTDAETTDFGFMMICQDCGAEELRLFMDGGVLCPYCGWTTELESMPDTLEDAAVKAAYELPDEYDPVAAVGALPETLESHEVNSALMGGEIKVAIRWCRYYGIEIPPDLNVDNWLNATGRPDYIEENFSDVMILSRRISEHALQKARGNGH